MVVQGEETNVNGRVATVNPVVNAMAPPAAGAVCGGNLASGSVRNEGRSACLKGRTRWMVFAIVYSAGCLVGLFLAFIT
jgi:hypothetical protein